LNHIRPALGIPDSAFPGNALSVGMIMTTLVDAGADADAETRT
jgi:hypothetical protein